MTALCTPVCRWLRAATTHLHHLPAWRRLALVASVALLLATTLFGVDFGVGYAQGLTAIAAAGKPAHGKDASPTASGPMIPSPLKNLPKAGAPRDFSKEIGPRSTAALGTPFTVALTANTAAHGSSPDGILEVDVPADALTTADMADTSAGPHHLTITPILPASGSTNGGHVSLGMYLVQVQDRRNQEVISGVGLRDHVTVTYHLPIHTPALDYAHMQVVVNGAMLPQGVIIHKQGPTATSTATTATVAAPKPITGATAGGSPTLGTTALQGVVPLAASGTTFSFTGTSPEAYFGKADAVQANLNVGGLSDTIPLDIPSGPGGLAPPVQLAYNSANVAANHSNASPAGWVGEGWDLDVGAITWSQTNRGSCNQCSSDWESSWHLSDPYGTSAELIPPTTTTDTYYDNTTNAPNANKVFWHTAPEQHAKIVSYTNPAVDCTHFPQPNAGCSGPTNYASQPPCYRVWLASGIMEEFGCTPDSLQYYPAGPTNDEFMVSAWKLDLVTDPSGNQIHFAYTVDSALNPNNTTYAQYYPRDIVLSTIEWDSPSCHDANTRCTGTAWQPLLQLQFSATTAVAYANGNTCGAAVNGVRCDDAPKTDAAPAPMVTSTQVLNDLYVNVRPSASGGWNRLRRYAFLYSQTAGGTQIDPMLDQMAGIAGNLLLTRVLAFGIDDNTSYPAQSFSYTPQTETAVNVFVSAGPTSTPLNRYFGTNNGYDDHWDTTGSVSANYHFEETNGWVLSNLAPRPPNTVPLYSCLSGGWDHFLSKEVNCEGQQLLRLEGYLYNTPPAGVEVHIIYRCVVNNGSGDHFISMDAGCEGQKLEGGLGYVMNNPHQPCGPMWNYNCYQWTQTTNTQFLATADNGQGQTQTFSWAIAHNNTHHPYQGATQADPLACDGHENTWPCNVADDGAWSQAVLTVRSSTTQDAANRALTATWGYSYVLTNLTSKECGDCDVGMYWGDENSGDYLNYYDGAFKGFSIVTVRFPDTHAENHYFYTTEGWGVYDTSKAGGCQNAYRDGNSNLIPCSNSPSWDLPNAASGREIYVDTYAGFSNAQWGLTAHSGSTYTAVCPPGGIGGSPASGQYGDWGGHLVSELNPSNPVAACDVARVATQTSSTEGVDHTVANPQATASVRQTSLSYDFGTPYGHGTGTTVSGSNLTTTPTIDTTTAYIWNDSISTAGAVPVGTYLVDRTTRHETSDGTTTLGCQYTYYDNLGWIEGQSNGLSQGLPSIQVQKPSCSGTVTTANTTLVYDASGDRIETTDADGNAGISSHHASICWQQTTTCQGYDTNYGMLSTWSANAANQTNGLTYDPSAGYGFDLWPKNVTDGNGQVTSTNYDGLGRVINIVVPGGTTTNALAYHATCPATGSALACLEVDASQRIIAATIVTTQAFYDGAGRLIETRKPGPISQDVVQYALYDNAGRQTFLSQPFFVASGSGYVTPSLNELGTVTAYNGFSQPLTVTGPTGDVTSTAYSTPCAIVGTNGDQACYSATTTTDANGHQSASYVDALGRTVYTQQWTGRVADGNLTLYRTIQQRYDVLGHVVESDYSDGRHSATATYDAMGRKTTLSDPDLGTYQLTYDPNGNLLTSIDPRGSAGLMAQGYDGLNRLVWKSNHSDGSSPLATYSYDSTASGNQGVGHLTGETFASGPSQGTIGSYAYGYDARGRQTGWTMALGGQNYNFSTGYNDADQPTTLTYPDGDVVTTSYSAQDWLAGVTEAKSGTTTTLLNSLVYGGNPGAAMKPSQAVIGNNTYRWMLGYDAAERLSHTTVAQVSNSATLFDQSRTFDAVGNVISTNTTLPQGTDHQTFCYDGLNRLVWAGNMGPTFASCVLPTGSTLTGQNARYQQADSYDVLNRYHQGPAGLNYQYADPQHLDAVTSAPGYSAAYDVAGNMTTRNGQQLGYDALRRLITWQNTVTNPTQTASYAYNGEGQRVQQVINATGTITTTRYIGTQEEVSTTGSTTTTLKYYNAGPVTAIRVNGTLSYEVSDNLGSVSQALSATGGVTATQLYAPYGTVRYTQGTMPSSHGFTDQRLDPSGLMYYNARYYDPSAGQFTSADDVQGTNRYAYVVDNPLTLTDPSGTWPWDNVVKAVTQAIKAVVPVVAAVANAALGVSDMINDVKTVFDPSKSWQDKVGAVVNLAFNATMDVTTVIGVGEGLKGAYVGAKALLEAGGKAAAEEAEHVAEEGATKLAEEGSNGIEDLAKGCNSFRGDTPVATPIGSQAIATLKVGDQVTAYDSKTGKAQPETVQHVFINHDDNLLDVTIADAKPLVAATDSKNKQQDAATAAHGSQAPPTPETLHTTTEHPFLTDDRGFVDAVKLVPGEHVTKLDGSLGVVVSVTIVPGQAVRYNLTVQDEHTFAVGQGQWVVHNCPIGDEAEKLARPELPPTAKNTSDFGQRIMKWGQASSDIPRARILTITKDEMEAQGVTRDIAQSWRDFYREVMIKNPANPSAPGRADLMHHVFRLLGGEE